MAVWAGCPGNRSNKYVLGKRTGFRDFFIATFFGFFLPVNNLLRKMTGFMIPGMGIIKILLAILILWASLGVGELFDKIDLMMQNL